jgi:hypothetical protein
MITPEHKAAFLVGKATITAAQALQWARELDSMVFIMDHGAVAPDEPLMVSVLPSEPPRTGLSGATVISGPFGKRG